MEVGEERMREGADLLGAERLQLQEVEALSTRRTPLAIRPARHYSQHAREDFKKTGQLLPDLLAEVPEFIPSIDEQHRAWPGLCLQSRSHVLLPASSDVLADPVLDITRPAINPPRARLIDPRTLRAAVVPPRWGTHSGV